MKNATILLAAAVLIAGVGVAQEVEVVYAQVKKRKIPYYPTIAIPEKVTARIMMTLVVGVDGVPDEISVVESGRSRQRHGPRWCGFCT